MIGNNIATKTFVWISGEKYENWMFCLVLSSFKGNYVKLGQSKI